MINNYVPSDFFSPSNPTIPTAFADGYSLKEEVGKLITYVNGLYQAYTELYGSNETLTTQYNELLQRINIYQTELDNFLNGYTIPDHSVSLQKLSMDIMAQLQQWVTDYMYNMHNFVSFGIEGDNFVAYIPQTWKDIDFETDTEGHLILNF